MFDFVTNHKRLLQIILGLTILPFAFFGLDQYTRSSGSGTAAATVDGSPISMREYSDEQRRQQDRLRQVLGQNADLAQFDTPEMRLAIVDSLISQRLLLNEVANAGLPMSKEEVVAFIVAAPEFQEGGKFSSERYANYLRASGLSDAGNVAKLRIEIPASRLASTIAGTAMQSRTVAGRLATLEGEKREVAEAFISAEPFLARIKPDDAAMKTYYDANPTEFKVPERIRAEFAVLSAEALGKAESVSEAELKTAFDARAAQYGAAEQRRASHILVKTKDEGEKLLAEARKAPQQFGELAKKHSLDTGSAANGGDLGMNAKGSLASKQLEEEIFRLKQGEVGLVQSEFGFHLVRLAAIQAGKAGSIEDARKELTAEIAKQKGARKFTELAEQFNNLVYEQSDSLKPAAERYKLKIETSGWITKEGGREAGPLAHPKLLAALFSQDSTRQRRNTDAVEVAPGVLVAARVAEHQPETQRPFEEVKADVGKRLARKEATAMARKEGEVKLAALAKGDSAGLNWAASKAVSRQEPQGLSQVALRKVMSADAAKLPAYTGADRADEGFAIYRIGKVVPAAARSEEQAKELQARYDQQAGSEQLDSYLLSLRARSKVEVQKANLEQKQ